MLHDIKSSTNAVQSLKYLGPDQNVFIREI